MKKKRKQQEVVCTTCQTTFLKDVSEVKRNEKLGRKNYCSLSCASKTKENLEHLDAIRNRDVSKLDPANRRDEYSEYREHFRRCKRRGKEVDITLEDLKEIFEQQQGICVYSKVKLKHIVLGELCEPIYTASLDRIDSSKGYVKDNIQFVSVAMNHLKNKMSHEEMLQAIEVIQNAKQ